MARRYFLPQQPMEAGRITIAHAVVGYCVIAFSLTMSHPAFRPLTYAIPFLAVIAMLASERASLPPHAAPFMVLILSGLAYAPVVPLVGWQDLYLFLIGLTPFFFGWRYRFSWPQIFVASVLITGVWLVLGRTAGADGGIEFDALKSKSSFESPMSWIFGVLAVWAAVERRWARVALALVLCVLTLKRIVVVGAVAAIIVCLLPRRFADLLLRPVPMLLANAAYLVAVVAYTQGHFDGLIHQFTGQSANQLGMGRQYAYARPVGELLSHPIESVFHGVGPGGVYDLMKGGWTFLSKPNLHNDSLKILVEYGGIVWVAFFAALFMHRDIRVRIMMLFYNCVMLTDNSLIYTYVLFVLGLALTRMLDPHPEEPAAEGRPANRWERATRGAPVAGAAVARDTGPRVAREPRPSASR